MAALVGTVAGGDGDGTGFVGKGKASDIRIGQFLSQARAW